MTRALSCSRRGLLSFSSCPQKKQCSWRVTGTASPSPCVPCPAVARLREGGGFQPELQLPDWDFPPVRLGEAAACAGTVRGRQVGESAYPLLPHLQLAVTRWRASIPAVPSQRLARSGPQSGRGRGVHLVQHAATSPPLRDHPPPGATSRSCTRPVPSRAPAPTSTLRTESRTTAGHSSRAWAGSAPTWSRAIQTPAPTAPARSTCPHRRGSASSRQLLPSTGHLQGPPGPLGGRPSPRRGPSRAGQDPCTPSPRARLSARKPSISRSSPCCRRRSWSSAALAYNSIGPFDLQLEPAPPLPVSEPEINSHIETARRLKHEGNALCSKNGNVPTIKALSRWVSACLMFMEAGDAMLLLSQRGSVADRVKWTER